MFQFHYKQIKHLTINKNLTVQGDLITVTLINAIFFFFLNVISNKYWSKFDPKHIFCFQCILIEFVYLRAKQNIIY